MLIKATVSENKRRLFDIREQFKPPNQKITKSFSMSESAQITIPFISF